jgi:hypothetical protein
MSAIDISAEITVNASPADVDAVMFDPAREPEWIKAVTGVEVVDPALAPGARVVHRGAVMGRQLSWTTQVETVHFPHVLTLRVTDGPFLGTVQYHIQRAALGSSVKIRSVGEAAVKGFMSSLIAGPLKQAMGADLERLKTLVEGAH